MTLRLFVPITKVDEERRRVYGVLAEQKPDKVGEIFDYAKSKPHFVEWSQQFTKATEGKSAGNLRVMHQPKVAGHFEAIEFNDKAMQIEGMAHVTDEDEWKKVLAGDYTGFSIGGKYAETWDDPENSDLRRYSAIPAEVSLVDNPCMGGATFSVLRANGTTEVRKFAAEEKPPADAPPAPDPAPTPAPSQPVPDPPPEPLPDLEVKPVQEGDKGTGGESKTLNNPAVHVAPVEDAGDAATDAGKVAKDAAAAVAAADSAIGSLKALAQELLGMEGDPDTWTLDAIICAIRGALSGKYSAQAAAEGDGGMMEMAAVSDRLEKIETALKGGQEDVLAKTVAAAVADAVKVLPTREEVDALTARVSKMEAAPAPVGKPVNKTLGTDGASNPRATVEQMTEFAEAALVKARAEGLSEKDIAKMRLALTQEIFRRTA